MASNYGFQKYESQKMARARMLNQGISTKDSVEIAKAVRGRSLDASIALMEKVVSMQQPIKYTRFNAESAAHKPGIGSGRYPIKAATVFLQLLELVKANAGQKDLDEDALKIVHIKADKASTPYHFGRHRGRKMKRTHLEIVVVEDDAVKAKSAKKIKKSGSKKPASKPAKKSDEKSDKKTEADAAESKKEAKAEEKPKEKADVKEAEAKKEPEAKADVKKETKAEEKLKEKADSNNEDNKSQGNGSKEEKKE